MLPPANTRVASKSKRLDRWSRIRLPLLIMVARWVPSLRCTLMNLTRIMLNVRGLPNDAKTGQLALRKILFHLDL
ncbi:hypothetical protein Q31b_08590 [Novipirellula aureliae]|uniref:Uncharacterized protein n=1 Tax=Novipirellula aureliae TaxID=2527966 RepID=A0A5C6E7Q9_9BACT|nr:hypothetical protein Q31b_08590 [Novipirellula aureliae]